VCRAVIRDPGEIKEFGCISSGEGGGDFVPLPSVGVRSDSAPVGPTTAVYDPFGLKFEVPVSIKEAYDRIKASDGTKLMALIQHLRVLFRETPDDKAIVFTQFTGMYDRVKSALVREGIEFVHIHGAMTRPQRWGVAGVCVSCAGGVRSGDCLPGSWRWNGSRETAKCVCSCSPYAALPLASVRCCVAVVSGFVLNAGYVLLLWFLSTYGGQSRLFSRAVHEW
jgi:hypothetical protein